MALRPPSSRVDPASPETQNSLMRRSRLVVVAFATVYIVWGSTYLAMRVGIESFPPLILAGVRHLLVGLVLYPILRWKTGLHPAWPQWRTAIITGCLLLLANGGVCTSEKTVPSGVAALLVATVSLWMVLIDWVRPGGVRPVARVLAGLVLGFSGLALLVGPKDIGGSARIDAYGAGILMVSSLAWACGSVYSKHGSLPSSPLLGLSMQSLAGGTALCLLALATGQQKAFHFAAVSARSWLAITYLGVFGSMIGFTAYLYILQKSSATRVATYAFVNPVIALFLGWLFAGESFTLRTALAAAVILTAVLLVITAPHPKAATPLDEAPPPAEI